MEIGIKIGGLPRRLEFEVAPYFTEKKCRKRNHIDDMTAVAILSCSSTTVPEYVAGSTIKDHRSTQDFESRNRNTLTVGGEGERRLPPPEGMVR